MYTMKECTVYKTIDIIGKKWTLLILLELYKGQKKYKRFNEMKNRLQNITPKVLSGRLKEMEKIELVQKNVDSSFVPIKSEYALTKKGEELLCVVQEMKRWGLKWKMGNKECGLTTCKECVL